MAGVWAFGKESLARAGWIGDRGTVVVDGCADDLITIGIGAKWEDCSGLFTAAGGTTAPEPVVIANSRELATGSRVEVLLVGDVAYLPHWGDAIAAAITMLVCAAFGGIVIVPLLLALHARVTRRNPPVVTQRRRIGRSRRGRRAASRGGRPN
ncbi:hypothetical protein JCM9534A_14880 [Catenuloplanes indicus JCM 9534]